MKHVLLAVLLASSPLLPAADRDRVGAFEPGTTLAPLAVASPESDSRTFVRTVVPVAGRAVVDLPATSTGTLLVWVLPSRGDGLAAMTEGSRPESRDLETRLVTPSGLTIGPVDDGGRGDAIRRFRIEEFGADELGLPLGPRQEALRVLRAEPGLHHLEISAPDGSAVTIAAVELDSPLVLTTWASPLSRQPGEPVSVHARLVDGAAPLDGASLTARLAAEGGPATEPVALFDDGRHGDGAAGDGHWAATVDDLSRLPAGHVSVRVDAEGTDARGRVFARTGATGLVNERGSARLVPGSVHAEWAVDEEVPVLRVSATAAVREGGDYRLDVLAGGAALSDGSRTGLAWAERTGELAAGSQELTVAIPAALLGDGPVYLDVRLLGLSRPGVAGRVTLSVER